MTLAYLSIVLLLVLFIIPYGMGCILIKSKELCLTWMGGFFVSLCAFEVLALIFHAVYGSLHVMVILWCMSCGSLACLGFFRGKKPDNPLSKIAFSDWSRTEKILLLLVAILILLQTLNNVLNTTYRNWDDETYCANAVGSWYTDKVNRCAPQSGIYRNAFYDKKYTLAAWPIYSSMLAVLSHVHPAIIYRTVLPLFEVPFAFFIIYLLLRHFFSNNRSAALLGLLFSQMFIFVAAENSSISKEWWRVANCWTGKALSFHIISPLILWLLFRIESEQSTVERNKLWYVLIAVCGASCLIAASMFMTVPLLLAVWGIFYLLRIKNTRNLLSEFIRLVICAAPTTLCAIILILK